MSLDGLPELPAQANEYPRSLFLAEVPQTPVSPDTVEFAPVARQPAEASEAHTGLTHSSSLSSLRFDHATSNNRSASPLPELVIKPSPGLDPEALSYLTSMGVFDLPPPAVVRDVLECFINYVYPLLPILDLHSLLEELYGSAPQISLLLLYGILLAGSGFTHQDTVEQAGYPSRFEWRSRLGRKLRVSHDLPFQNVPRNVTR